MVRRHRVIAASALVALLRVGGLASANAGERPGRADLLAEADSFLARVDTLAVPADIFFPPDVLDPVFGFLVGLLDQDQYGSVLDTHFKAAVNQCGRESRLPYELIREVRRVRGGGPRFGWVRAEFTEPLKVAVPYSILGYHPGSLVSTQEVTVAEWRIARIHVPNPYGENPGVIELQDVTLWGLVSGRLLMDIDGWLDRLMGGKLDDTHIVGLAIFRYQEQRLAMALGFSKNGEGRSGALDVTNDKMRFPAPEELKAIGRTLRGRVLQLLAQRGMPAWTPPGRKG